MGWLQQLSGCCVELNDEGMGSFHKAQGQLCLAASIYLTPCLSVGPHLLAIYNWSLGAQTPINSRAIKQPRFKNACSKQK